MADKDTITKLNPYKGTQYTTAALEVKSFEETEEDGQNFGYFKGYAATFGNIDRTDDIIEEGAFKTCLGNRKVKMCWQHDMQTPIGSFPVMKEDDHGLYVEGRVNLGTMMGREAYALLKAGDLDSMSIGFMVKNYEIDEKSGIRTIKEADLWEISIVTEPANSMAMVTSVKSLEDAETLAEVEKILRSKGFSKKESKTVIGKVKAISRCDAAQLDGQKEHEATDASTPDDSRLSDELAALKSLFNPN